MGQMAVDEKSNETAAIPKILEMLDLHGYIVTSNATGTQAGIARQIREQGGEHVLALMGKPGLHGRGHEGAGGGRRPPEGPEEAGILQESRRERAWPDRDVRMLDHGPVRRDHIVAWRYFLTILPPDVGMFAEGAKGRWRIEAMGNVLDAALGEDASRTIERTAAENLAVARKWTCLILCHVDIGCRASLRSKAGYLSHDPEPALRMLARLSDAQHRSPSPSSISAFQRPRFRRASLWSRKDRTVAALSALPGLEALDFSGNSDSRSASWTRGSREMRY